MSKRILLVNPSYNYPVKSEMYPSGALLLLGTLAKKNGNSVKIVHMVADSMGVSEVTEVINSWVPDIVGITINTFQVRMAKELCRRIKADTKAFVVIGGPHPTSIGMQPAEVAFPEADYIIIGEGEHAFLTLLSNQRIPKPKDLEYIVPPDLSLVNLSRFTGAYPLGSRPTMFTMASRGCPGKCTFCNRSIFGNKVRYRSPENVLRELRYFARYGIKEVFIQDDTFNLNKSWYREILQMIISEKLNTMMQFRVPFRADEKLVDKQTLELSRMAGIWLVFYGVESGNQDMLDRIHKGITLEEMDRAVRLTKEAGIMTETSFIVGLPGETLGSISDTLRFYHMLNPFWSGCSTAIPFPSTELYQEVCGQITIPFDAYRPGMPYFHTDTLDKSQIAVLNAELNRIMLHGKVKSMAKRPGMLLRTVRDRVR